MLGISVTVAYRRFSLDLSAGRTSQTLSQITLGIEEEIRRTTLLAANLSTDAESTDAVASFAGGRTSRQSCDASKRMEEKLSAFFHCSNRIGCIALYLRGQPTYLYRMIGRSTPGGRRHSGGRVGARTARLTQKLSRRAKEA